VATLHRRKTHGALLTRGWNIFVNTLSTFLSTLPVLSTTASASGSLHPPSPPRIVGITLYPIGNFLETFSEIQRKRFKLDKRNEEKVFNQGLFALERHVNFGGFTLAAVGWGPVVGMFGFLLWAFTNNGIPALDRYCAKRVRLLLFWYVEEEERLMRLTVWGTMGQL
jgi:steroid 5-alpha reductase family enzyme